MYWDIPRDRTALTPAAKSSERPLGLLSAAGVFCIWSGFLVFSRAGVQSGLTPFDLTALRFLVAGVLILPFALAWWPRHLPLRATLSMSICGPGALYNVLMYFGLKHSSAAYGGVFANGTLPVFTILLGFFFARQVPSRRQLIAVIILVVGAVLIGVPGLRSGGNSVVSAIALFLAASAVLSVYFLGVKHWQVEPRQALALVSLPNAAIFLPVWFFLLPSTIHEAPWPTILLQGAFDDTVEFAHDTQASERRIGDQGQAFPGEVVDQGQDTEAPATDQRVHQEVERPAQVLVLRDRHRRAGAQCPFAAPRLAHGQPLILVEPIQLLPIDPDPLPSQ